MTSELYSPLCEQCAEFGDYTLGVEQVEGPMGRQWACVRHVREAEEAALALWQTDVVSAAESISRGYDAMERRR